MIMLTNSHYIAYKGWENVLFALRVNLQLQFSNSRFGELRPPSVAGNLLHYWSQPIISTCMSDLIGNFLVNPEV